MDTPLQILWVNDDLNGPENGLALFQGKKVWFVRNMIPDVVSSIPTVTVPMKEFPEESSSDGSKPVTYTLIELSPELLEKIENDHASYCEKTGTPLRHGDPWIIKKRAPTTRMDWSKVDPEGLPISPKGMASIQSIPRQINYQSIYGDYITTVTSSDFINFNVPHAVEYR